jgi:Uncharacterized protein conserved in bacteria
VNALRLVKSGDWLVFAAGLLTVAWLTAQFWHRGGTADRVVIRSGGKVFAEVTLSGQQSITVPGPLGESVVEIDQRRARVARDPSPRQYCVQQGWISRAGEAAICLPNQVSIELAGAEKAYDSLNY